MTHAHAARALRDRQLLRRYHASPTPAGLNALAARFLPLARRAARAYVDRGESYEDLLQVASLGLVKAIERFDCDSGHAFSTYAMPTMTGEIKRHFRDAAWAVHVPRSVKELAAEAKAARTDLEAGLGRTPTTDEIAGHIGRPAAAVDDALEASTAFRPRSLDEPDPHQDGDRPADREPGAPDPGFGLVDDRSVLRDVTAHLDDRERRILWMRFAEERKQWEIGEEIGVSQVQVSRLLAASVGRLRERTETSLAA